MVEQSCIVFDSPGIRKVPAEFQTIMRNIKGHFDSWIDVNYEDV